MLEFLRVVFTFNKGGDKFAMTSVLTENPSYLVTPDKEFLWDFSNDFIVMMHH